MEEVKIKDVSKFCTARKTDWCEEGRVWVRKLDFLGVFMTWKVEGVIRLGRGSSVEGDGRRRP